MSIESDDRAVEVLEEIRDRLSLTPQLVSTLQSVSATLDDIRPAVCGGDVGGKSVVDVTLALSSILEELLDLKVAIGGYVINGEYRPTTADLVAETLVGKLDEIGDKLDVIGDKLDSINTTLEMNA